MPEKKRGFKALCPLAVLCWCGTVVPAVYVLWNAVSSMNGTVHGFHGEMIYGAEAFLDTVFMYLTFFFPFALLWGLCLAAAVALTIVIFDRKRKAKSQNHA